MVTKICACCGQPFQPRPQVPNQAYCSSPACQRERRQAWQRQNLQDDRFYRENLQDAQRAWRDRNPGYSRNYRAANPKYVEKNRNQQRSKPPLARKSDLAKMDASTCPTALPAGVYRVRPLQWKGTARIGTWIVEITPACADCPCKTDACKDRT